MKAMLRSVAFFLELFPALRCNLFVFKEKTKRIFTSIRAMLPQAFFCLDPRRSRTERSYTKETKDQGFRIKS